MRKELKGLRLKKNQRGIDLFLKAGLLFFFKLVRNQNLNLPIFYIQECNRNKVLIMKRTYQDLIIYHQKGIG